MKKLTLLIAAAIFAVMTLTGCEPDRESSGWLKGTTWKAILDEDNGDGSIKIHFTQNGYRLNIDARYNKVRAITRFFPDYEYPTLYFPISWDEEDGKPVNVIYNIGTISEDLKTIHFDSFRDRGYTIGSFSGYNEYKDIDFIRQ